MKILLVLMCYINHLSGYISYSDTGYWLIFFQYAGNLNETRLAVKDVVSSTLILSFLEFAGKTGLLSAR
jgi:hypothetical protein